MPRPVRLLALVLSLALLTPLTASAQDSSPKVNVVVRSADQLIKDLKLLSDLTSKVERAQWENIKDVLDTFLFGVDVKKPVGIEILLGGEGERVRLAVPISDLTEFRDENLGGFEIATRKLSASLYRLSENKSVIGYMRYASRYATIGEKRSDVNRPLLPQKQMAGLLARNFSLGAKIRNKPGGQDSRRRAFAPVRKNLLAALKAGKGESADRFLLRKQALSYQLDELERFFVESQALTAGLRFDPVAKQARLDLDLTALPQTQLAASIKQLATEPSYFATVTRSKQAILAGRINHPLDTFRRAGLQVLLNTASTAWKGEIQAETSTTTSQKAASTKLIEIVQAVVAEGLTKGMFDGFLEVRPTTGDAGKNVMVGGLRTAGGGERLRDALALLPDSTHRLSVKLDVAKVGDVSIHQATVPGDLHDDFVDLFGPSNTVYIGTSANAVWCAAGPGAIALLKTTIASAGGKPPEEVDPYFIDLQIKAAPWLKLLDSRLGDKGDPADRKMALDAFEAGDDTIRLQMQRQGNKVVGHTTLGTGILRFLGKKIAAISKENFE